MQQWIVPTRRAKPIRCNVSPRFLILLFLLLLLALNPLSAKGLGYAFSGGGARGYAHIGMLKVLEEYGIYPDYISGTSIGAIVGGLYAMGYTASEIEQVALSLNWDLVLDDTQPRSDLYIGQKRWAPLGSLNLELDEQFRPQLPSSVIVGNNINLELFRLFSPASGVTDFSQLPIPFTCLATDLVTGKEVMFSQGSLMQAVRASLSVPSIVYPFEYEGRILIDGGIVQNLPVTQVRAMGADCVIGFKVNSELRSASELNSLITILDQTVNIGMTRNLDENLSGCGLLLEPDLEEFRATHFRNPTELIAKGEAYARENADRIIAWRDSLLNLGYTFSPKPKLSFPDRVKVTGIKCHGNKYISSAKITQYLDLPGSGTYTIARIASACREAWNSAFFHTVYPVLRPAEEGFSLEIHVRERQRSYLALNHSYTSEEALNLSLILGLNNRLQKNSTLLAGLTLGGRTELNLDYVKNFGDFWGSYFRIFGYLSEKRLYLYDEDYNRVESVKTLEYGATPGVGVFAEHLAIAEAYLYSYQTKLYRDVTTTPPIDKLYLISGFGIKMYHESLDDYMFPKSGIKASAKLSFSRWSELSEKIYNKFQGKAVVYSQLADYLSLRLGMEHGSYFESNADNSFDPFYFSGSRGYRGYQLYAVSSPQYTILDTSLVFNPLRNLFLESGLQGLNLRSNVWDNQDAIVWSVFLELGYNNPWLPLRLSTSVRENAKPIFYLNLGYDYDIFWFSRR